MRALRFVLIVGLAVLLLLMVSANRIVLEVEEANQPAPCEPWEIEGSFAEPHCQGRVA